MLFRLRGPHRFQSVGGQTIPAPGRRQVRCGSEFGRQEQGGIERLQHEGSGMQTGFAGKRFFWNTPRTPYDIMSYSIRIYISASDWKNP